MEAERGFPGDSDSKESTCNAGDLGSIAGLGRSPGEGSGYLPQYSGLENSMDGCKELVRTKQLSLSRWGQLEATSLSYPFCLLKVW